MLELAQPPSLTDGMMGKHRTGTFHLPVYFLATSLLLLTIHCQAGSFLLIESSKGEIYNRFKSSLNQFLIKNGNSLTTRNIDSFRPQGGIVGIQKYDAIVSAGIEASITISRIDTKTTILMAMVPKESYYELIHSGDIRCQVQNCRVLYLDQPVNRQLKTLKLALPASKRITAIGSKNSRRLLGEISRSAVGFGLNINVVEISDEYSALTALNNNLANSDLLMAIPDPVVYNRNTARAILLSAFHQHIPLFAYSRSFVRAGATIGIYSTPEDIARHVAELLTQKRIITSAQQNIYPKYYTIDINQRAAEALGLALPEVQLLTQKLKAYEKE